MILVIFEVEPKGEATDDYFTLAAGLREELQKIDGFISIERFQSVTNPEKFLSLSTWRDEAAIEDWYCHSGHSAAQQAGRARIFKDYRIRVARVFRDYDMAKGRAGAMTDATASAE
ncbi:antibiotic biosynthesis monooxygenase family protein [Aquibaculum arenosum]|uniref:Antibiotic biosynthesis monooxygenase n=1 Tax=Aquibaculum arenosum TaxID=3032591 RepID=A0ABT5YK26_9PROT|nr:antibiotic biosynthesis monooxygenase [Fodinicurvata sp. CAU 1616]MDF2095249.1 antibiotic biosynthesis monooxygenase [Fodinicurvata sp. CAU 1616]